MWEGRTWSLLTPPQTIHNCKTPRASYEHQSQWLGTSFSFAPLPIRPQAPPRNSKGALQERWGRSPVRCQGCARGRAAELIDCIAGGCAGRASRHMTHRAVADRRPRSAMIGKPPARSLRGLLGTLELLPCHVPAELGTVGPCWSGATQPGEGGKLLFLTTGPRFTVFIWALRALCKLLALHRGASRDAAPAE